jgi:hypothetical protein
MDAPVHGTSVPSTLVQRRSAQAARSRRERRVERRGRAVEHLLLLGRERRAVDAAQVLQREAVATDGELDDRLRPARRLGPGREIVQREVLGQRQIRLGRRGWCGSGRRRRRVGEALGGRRAVRAGEGEADRDQQQGVTHR